MSRTISLELLPCERDVLLKWNSTPWIREQLEPSAGSDDCVTITISGGDACWLASDITHAIVKLGCSNEDAIDLSERLDFVHETGDGTLDSWYG